MRKLYKNRCGLLCILTMCLLCISCLPEDLVLPRVKDVATTGVGAVFYYGAKLSGVVTLVESADVECGIIYGRTTPFVDGESVRVACEDYTIVQVSDDSFECCFSVSIAGLMPNTTCYYCAYALDAGQYKYGEVRSFTTDVVEAVDLGLSVKWATCNVGAETPEEYGDYFAWGETMTKTDYRSSNSVTDALSISELEFLGIIDSDGQLTAAYDAATKNWGGSWRMPTKAELDELLTNCTRTWTTQNGVKGYKVTGPNGNSIFLPAAGYRENTSLYDAGSYGIYWSATPYSDSRYSCSLGFSSDGYDWYYGYRGFGRTVRPVYVAPQSIVSITTGEATDITTDGASLNGTLEGSTSSVACGFIYGKTTTLSSTSGTKVSTSSSGAYSILVSGLEDNTTYYYRAYAIIGGEEKYGEVRSFTTDVVGAAVDLGLSVKWATFNVGAETPEEYGDYFAWGETVTKSSYTESNSVTYGLSIEELESRGIIDSDGQLTAAYDAATVNWGGSWRMPTLDEMKELLNNCTWEWTTQNGVNGYKVTGTNGNSIFLPAAFYGAISYGYYWSASPYSSSNGRAASLYFYSGNYYWCDGFRYNGRTVRPVSER